MSANDTCGLHLAHKLKSFYILKDFSKKESKRKKRKRENKEEEEDIHGTRS